MFSRRPIDSFVAGAVMSSILLLGGCASTTSQQAAGEEPTTRSRMPRCPSGTTMFCEAQKVGRIRFGQFGKKDLESCSCAPESIVNGRSQQPALPQ